MSMLQHEQLNEHSNKQQLLNQSYGQEGQQTKPENHKNALQQDKGQNKLQSNKQL